MRSGPFLATSLVVGVLVVAGCSGGGTVATPGTVTGPSASAGSSALVTPPAASPGGPATTGMTWRAGQSLCVLLGPGDFTGVAGVTAPQDSSDAPGDNYCTYTPNTSGAQGGVEFDAFVGSDAAGTYATVLGEVGPGSVDAAVPGVDASVIAVAPSSGSAFIVVRKHDLVFTIAVPQGPQAEALLRGLANLVLKRGAAAVG